MFIEPASFSKQSVNRFLGEDHARLDSLFQKARAAFDSGRRQDGAALFFEFQAGLEQHLRMEEEILFPKFEALVPHETEPGPTQALRLDHREIRKLLRLIGDNLSAGESPCGSAEALHGVLQSHSLQEELVLYRLIDRVAGSALASELVHCMEAL